jgi:hypothetical protein
MHGMLAGTYSFVGARGKYYFFTLFDHLGDQGFSVPLRRFKHFRDNHLGISNGPQKAPRQYRMFFLGFSWVKRSTRRMNNWTHGFEDRLSLRRLARPAWG